MLHEEITEFEKLTGLDANDFSVDYLGGFLHGYDTGKAERLKSKWQVEMTGYLGKTVTSISYKCPECGRRIVYVPTPTNPIESESEFLANYPFCHCGVDMRGE